MSGKFLVAYASTYGSTEEIARKMGEILSQTGAAVDVLPAGMVEDIAPYAAVIIGTSVRAGKPLKDAAKFVKRFGVELSGKPVALFSVGIQVRDDTPENREKARAVLDPLIEMTGKPIEIGLFAGRIDYKKIGFPLSFFFKREPSGTMREGDWRDWDAVRAWAEKLAAKLG